MTKIASLAQFYQQMFDTCSIRRQIVQPYLEGKEIKQEWLDSLKNALKNLEQIPKKEGGFCLPLYGDKDISLDLSYEIDELKKDLFFLEHTEEEFEDYLASCNEGYKEQVDKGVAFLADVPLRNFVTDRDGTINNYCGRYGSSIQSVYNSVFLTRFAKSVVENAVLLTSAPLEDIGMVDVSVNPPGYFIYAGAKGRKYIGKKGGRGQKPITEVRQQKLDEFNVQVKGLLKQREYEIFSFIGSGLQLKFGQTTIARQNMAGSIPEAVSDSFLENITSMVRQIDHNREFLRIEDTGTDIEVILTIESSEEDGELKDFDKGDGVDFLDSALGLDLHSGANLICGDTNSDVPMVPASMAKTTETWAVFVTKDPELKAKVQDQCPNTYFVSGPDMLVGILNRLAKGGKK
jgi:hypothetical protein